MIQIDGYFNASNEPSVKLAVGSLTLELLVDTGFDGTLIVPGHVANHLALRYEGLQDLSTATEERIVAKAYSIEVGWFGKTVRVPVLVDPKLNQAILGGQMLEACRLTIDYRIRLVTIAESQ